MVWVEAQVIVEVSTDEIERHGSIIEATKHALDFIPLFYENTDDWTWTYRSKEEYDWADQVDFEPLTGEPWEEDSEDE